MTRCVRKESQSSPNCLTRNWRWGMFRSVRKSEFLNSRGGERKQMSNDVIEPRPADSGDVVPSVSDLVDVNVIELRLPCRSFRIRYKVAEPGEFSMTTE